MKFEHSKTILDTYFHNKKKHILVIEWIIDLHDQKQDQIRNKTLQHLKKIFKSSKGFLDCQNQV
jgi:hypothetical protein